MALALAAGAIFALGLGIRNALPLFISAINSSTAMGYATISLAFGVQQLMWGVAQPVAGAMADRWGPRPVMIGGALWGVVLRNSRPHIYRSIGVGEQKPLAVLSHSYADVEI